MEYPFSADRVPLEYTVHRVKPLRERPTEPVEYPLECPQKDPIGHSYPYAPR